MENNKIFDQVQKIHAKTKERKIPWKYGDINTVRWVRQDGNRLFTVTLQAQPLNVVVSGFIQSKPNNFSLTIQATTPNEILLQLNSAIDMSYREILHELFDEAMKLSKEGSSDIIDKMLDNL